MDHFSNSQIFKKSQKKCKHRILIFFQNLVKLKYLSDTQAIHAHFGKIRGRNAIGRWGCPNQNIT